MSDRVSSPLRFLSRCGLCLSLLVLAGCSSSEPETKSANETSCATSAASDDAGVDVVPRRKCTETEDRRCLPEDVLLRKGVAYSGYRKGEDPRTEKYPSEEEIKEDLDLLARGGWTLLRLFDSGVHGQRVLKVIRDHQFDMKVQLGVWIEGAKADHDEENRIQIEKGIELANTYDDIVVGVSIGNEVLDDWSSVRTPPEDLVEYIEEVRAGITQPVTTDDMYIPFKLEGQYENVLQVAQAIDYLSMHVYAMLDARWSWDWRQLSVTEGPERAQAMMDAAMKYTKAAVRGARSALEAKGVDIPIIIGEAGWKSRHTKTTDSGEAFRAHPVNQKIFYDRLMAWTYGSDRDEDSPEAAFYFEAFDEPWKAGDDGWGLFNVDRKANYVIWCDFPDLKPEGAPNYSPSDAVYFIRPDAASK